jgi:hypothetical protein
LSGSPPEIRIFAMGFSMDLLLIVIPAKAGIQRL